jgi:hypothetical protein
MWISKKKFQQELNKAKNQSFMEGMDHNTELEQWDRIEKLEKQVKKLKKIIKEGY